MYEMNKNNMEEMFNIAAMVLSERGELSPMYFVLKDNFLTPVVGTPEMSQQDVAAAVVNLAHEIDADAAILICEQWMVKFRKDDPNLQEYINGDYRPSQDEMRREALLTLTHMTKDGEADSIISDIKMAPNGIRYTDGFKWIHETVTNMIMPWATDETDQTE